jgi:hypothetical protein
LGRLVVIKIKVKEQHRHSLSEELQKFVVVEFCLNIEYRIQLQNAITVYQIVSAGR